MIKFLIEVIETVKWFFGHPTSPMLPMMLPGNRALEVAEQRQLSKRERDIKRMIKTLPEPDKIGKKITLVGQGFVIECVVDGNEKQKVWLIDG